MANKERKLSGSPPRGYGDESGSSERDWVQYSLNQLHDQVHSLDNRMEERFKGLDGQLVDIVKVNGDLSTKVGEIKGGIKVVMVLVPAAIIAGLTILGFILRWWSPTVTVTTGN